MQPLEQVEVDGGRGGKKEDGGEASQASHQGTPTNSLPWLGGWIPSTTETHSFQTKEPISGFSKNRMEECNRSDAMVHNSKSKVW